MKLKILGAVLLLALVIALVSGVSFADAPSPANAVVQAHLDAQNAHDLNAVVNTLADRIDVRVFGNDDNQDFQKVFTRDEQRKNFENAIRMHPNANFRVLSKIVTPSSVIVFEEGTNLTGSPKTMGTTLYKVTNGKISAIWNLGTEAVTQ